MVDITDLKSVAEGRASSSLAGGTKVRITKVEDCAENLVWVNVDPDNIWVMDKLILSRKLGYVCGPVGMDVPTPGYYMVRPCVNALGLGLGAQKVWIEEETVDLPIGHFWCEFFEGQQFSIDYLPKEGIKLNTILGTKSDDTFTKWDKWTNVENNSRHKIPDILFPTILSYDHINLEFIDDKLIEVHLRRNQDFDGDITEFIPVWEGQDITPPQGYSYRDYPDVHGRVGAFVK